MLPPTLSPFVLAFAASGRAVLSSAPPTTPCGPPSELAAAKKVMAAAGAEAERNHWGMAIAIVDSTGHMVMLHKLDNTQYGSIQVAEDKARSALDQGVRGLDRAGRHRDAHAGAPRSVAAGGAIPIIVDGMIIGAIGVSGATAVQDGQVAKAGADAAK